MPNLTDNDKLKKQTEQIFNIAEKPIMEFICAFLDEPCSVIFKDTLPEITNPVVLLPIINYKKDKYIEITLHVKKYSDIDENEELQRVDTLNAIIKYNQIKESIGFLVYCIKNVYHSIVSDSMFNNSPVINTVLELNESNWTFAPVFNHDLTIKKNFLIHTKNTILDFKNNNKEKLSLNSETEINDKLKDVLSKLDELNGNYSPAILDIEKKTNELYNSKPVICISVRELTKNELDTQYN